MFLGDSDFPKSALDYYKGGRIFFFQDLYEKYSRLNLSNQEDRPVAISGLEKRIIRTFATQGGYGVYESYLQRGLLWKRPDDSLLTPIQYPPDRHVPSWSWMSCSGGITYMNIPFNGAEWTNDVTSPFQYGTNGGNLRDRETNTGMTGLELVATARKLNTLQGDILTGVVFDYVGQIDNIDTSTLWCVVVGKARHEEPGKGPIHWVLVIKPRSLSNDPDIYERVGVGSLLSVHISYDQESSVRIR